MEKVSTGTKCTKADEKKEWKWQRYWISIKRSRDGDFVQTIIKFEHKREIARTLNKLSGKISDQKVIVAGTGIGQRHQVTPNGWLRYWDGLDWGTPTQNQWKSISKSNNWNKGKTMHRCHPIKQLYIPPVIASQSFPQTYMSQHICIWSFHCQDTRNGKTNWECLSLSKHQEIIPLWMVKKFLSVYCKLNSIIQPQIPQFG